MAAARAAPAVNLLNSIISEVILKRADYIDHDGNKTTYFYDSNHRTVRGLRPDGTG